MEQNNQITPESSLETPSPAASAPPAAPGEQLEGQAPEQPGLISQPQKTKSSFRDKLRSFGHRFNIYLLIFFLLIAVSITIIIVLVINSQSPHTTTIDSQTLTDQTLQQLANSDVSVGGAKQTLSVQSNAVFAGTMLVRQSLEVAGSITVGNSLNLPTLTVTGTGTFDTVQANTLGISNNATIQGQLSIQKSLTVLGGGSFSGPVTAPTINTSNLQLNGDLAINRHITTGGSLPTKTDGPALGSGGTSSVSGSDTAGSITVNTGNSPAAGCFITVNFAQKFGATPHVLVTPIGSAAGSLSYYVNRSATSFSVCSTNAAAGGQSFGFDYIILG